MNFGLPYGMGKKPKIIVPPREERLEALGDPKSPKMGGISPKAVALPEADELVEAMRKATAKKRGKIASFLRGRR